MSVWHVAQINVARFREPREAPVNADFEAELDEVNALAEASPMTLGKHRENVVQIAVVDDGSVAVSVGRDTTMHVWPLTPRRLWQLAERVRGGRGR